MSHYTTLQGLHHKIRFTRPYFNPANSSRQIDVSFIFFVCVCPLTYIELRHNIVVAVEPRA